jgi:predicted nucleic acid-binding protein
MMVVCDTSPLGSHFLIHKLELRPGIFGQVLIIEKSARMFVFQKNVVP